MKVALVHDFLIEYGGAERVLEALHEIWPKAPVYTAFYNPKSLGQQAKRFENWDIRTSWGTKLPFWSKLVSPYRIFSKSFFEHFDLSGYDLVISSSNAYMAKAVKVPNGIHVCYCHTPPRFLYGYPTGSNWKKNPILRIVGEVINHFMRVWDFEAAQIPQRGTNAKSGRVDYFIANSKEVQSRIKKFYRRDSTVIYPPVDTNKYKVSSIKYNGEQPYFLVVSRLVASKNVDLAVQVFNKIQLPLKVVGIGKDLEQLKARSKPSVEFLGSVDDTQLQQLYQNSRAVIFPATQEDFGLVPVEAMAAGKPVIALSEGGALETVEDKITGIFFSPATTGSLTMAVNNFIDLEKKGAFKPSVIRKHAEKFSKQRFKKEIEHFVSSKLE